MIDPETGLGPKAMTDKEVAYYMPFMKGESKESIAFLGSDKPEDLDKWMQIMEGLEDTPTGVRMDALRIIRRNAQDLAKRTTAAADEKLQQRANLEASAESRFKRNGGTDFEWTMAKDGIIADLLATGDAAFVVTDDVAERRRKAARTGW